MATRPRQTTLTYDNLQRFPGDGNRYELIDGELYVSPAPGLRHQRVVLRLTLWLAPHVEANSLGEVLVAPFDVHFSETDVVQPDLIYVSRERLGILEERYAMAAPDLVVEVLSASTAGYDRGDKQDIYARYGVKYYWQVDPRRRSMRALVLEGDGYREIVTAQGNEMFAATPFPDLWIRLADLWP